MNDTTIVDRWSVVELAAAVRSGRLTATELLGVSRERVMAGNDVLRAFVHLDWPAAVEAARDIDDRIAEGMPVGALAGVPFGVKDTQNCSGMPTRYGSLLHADAAAADHDDPSIARLRAADAIPIGKTATPEFASGLLCESRASGVTRNPWNPALTPGGSSGGSAAAVAAGMVPFATGTDGGGSIRIPASITGLVGLKTTFGLVPELDRAISQTSTVGALTWTVADTAAVLDVMVGGLPDRGEALVVDPFSLAVAPAGPLAAGYPSVALDGLRMTYVPTLDRAGATPEVAAACLAAAKRLIDRTGAVEIADAVQLDAGSNEIFVGAGSADPWSLFDFGDVEKNRPLFSDYFAQRLDRTGAVGVQELGLFLQRRRALRRELVSWFDEVDVVIMPTLSTTEIPAEGPPPSVVPGQEYEGVAAVAPLTRIANLAGAPSITVPVGRGANGAPIGLMLVVAPGRDELALALGAAVEADASMPVAARPYLG